MPLISCFSVCAKTRSDTVRSVHALPYNICRIFSLSELKAATNNFHPDRFIGHGPYSKVYKGHVGADPATPVAVSRLNAMSEQSSRLFKTEVRVLCQLSHPNIVLFLGLYERKRHIILVHEYMSNGTLRDRLDDAEAPLQWTDRLKICIDSARGLHYLHAGAKFTLLHRRVRPKNIRIDSNMNAKISDSGLSRLMRHSYGVVDEYTVDADLGYLAEEVIVSGRYTPSSDVYAFGVVLFDVLCAKRPLDARKGAHRANLGAWARACAEEGSVGNDIDPCLAGKIESDCLRRFVEVAASCLVNTVTERPAMGEVVERLENVLLLQESYVPSS